jgi:hypothetical protein
MSLFAADMSLIHRIVSLIYAGVCGVVRGLMGVEKIIFKNLFSYIYVL